MSDVSYRELSANGLWNNNPAIVQLLGLCPLLAVTGNVANALGLGIATIFVLTTSNTAVSLIRNVTSEAVRLPTFVMIIAASVTCIELLMQAYAFEMYQTLGIFLALITTNCVILGRADGFARKHAVLPSLYDGLVMGVGFTAVLLVLGALRELAGTGALFADMDLLFGPSAAAWEIVVFSEYQPFLLAILPPGAFIFTGFLIAVKNIIDTQIRKRRDAAAEPVTAGSRRVRVTGNVS
jgi:electron transport complex protein RnfE